MKKNEKYPCFNDFFNFIQMRFDENITISFDVLDLFEWSVNHAEMSFYESKFMLCLMDEFLGKCVDIGLLEVCHIGEKCEAWKIVWREFSIKDIEKIALGRRYLGSSVRLVFKQ